MFLGCVELCGAQSAGDGAGPSPKWSPWWMGKNSGGTNWWKWMKMMVHHGSPLDLGIRNVWRIPTGGRKFSVRCMCFHHVLPYYLFIFGNKNGDDAQLFLGGISFSAPYQTFRLEWRLLNVDWANCLSLFGVKQPTRQVACKPSWHWHILEPSSPAMLVYVFCSFGHQLGNNNVVLLEIAVLFAAFCCYVLPVP